MAERCGERGDGMTWVGNEETTGSGNRAESSSYSVLVVPQRRVSDGTEPGLAHCKKDNDGLSTAWRWGTVWLGLHAEKVSSRLVSLRRLHQWLGMVLTVERTFTAEALGRP